MKVKNKNFSTIWLENSRIKIIDQTKLPFEFKIKELKTLEDFCRAIKNMEVRGAPLIGVTAAFGLAISIKKNSSNKNIKRAYEKLLSTRPTAVNLRWALNFILKNIQKIKQNERAQRSFQLAKEMRDEDIINCFKIGVNGYKIIEKIYKEKKRKINILTHCNAGWLATVDWGTALSPIFLAHRNGIPIHVWVDETRPRNQGALLTAWELKNEKIPHTIIVDNAGGYLMQNKKVDICLVGSDRTTANGDVCNKIGTYLKALSAHDNKIPFYVALPFSTIDLNIKQASKIPIEIRDEKELSHLMFYKNKKIEIGDIYFDKPSKFNPAFDVTPSRYITKLITENGIINPSRLDILKYYRNDKN
tara:strand:- start:1110 stop:2189 length:1080 start_codon:yes stop_codon:yes gene_type:complete